MVTNVLWRNDVTISIPLSHRIGSNIKQSKQSMNADNKLLETVFVILFPCMFHDDKMDISAYILIKLIGTAFA